MRNYTLGPALETYGPNVRILAILSAIALLFCWLSFAVAWEVRDQKAWIVFWALTAGFAGIIGHYLASRVWVHQLGLTYRGIFGYGEIRWLEVERFYFGSYEVHAHYFPLGTFHRLKIVSTQGRKISFGEHVRRADELAATIGKFTFEPLLQKALQKFNFGSGVDFGAIRMHPAEGLTLVKWYADKKIRWDELQGYDVTSAYLKFHRFGKTFAWTVSAERVANVPVLRALLDSVMGKVWQRVPQLTRSIGN